MRDSFTLVCVLALAIAAFAQQPSSQAPAVPQPPAVEQPIMPAAFGTGRRPGESSADFKLREMWESKIKVEWEAIKNKDKKTYAELLADDYQGVEVDGKGERRKMQALNELPTTNVANYTLWGLSVIPVGEDAALVTYEVTMQFPPRAAIRLSRVYIGELWVKRGGEWKELHYQETHVK